MVVGGQGIILENFLYATKSIHKDQKKHNKYKQNILKEITTKHIMIRLPKPVSKENLKSARELGHVTEEQR